MRLNKLFLETDADLQGLLRNAKTGDEELINQYLTSKARLITIGDLAQNDEAILKFASYLENSLRSNEEQLLSDDTISKYVLNILDGAREANGDFVDEQWSTDVDSLFNIGKKSLSLRLVRFGDLLRCVHRPLPLQSRENYINAFAKELNLDLRDLIKIVYL